MIGHLFLEQLRKIKLRFYLWEVKQEFPLDVTPFDSNAYVQAATHAIAYVKTSDLEKLELVNKEFIVHDRFDKFALAIDTAISCLQTSSPFSNPLKPIPYEQNSYAWLLGDFENNPEEKNFDVFLDKMQILSGLIKEHNPGRSFQRAIKPLCEDIDKVLDILETI